MRNNMPVQRNGSAPMNAVGAPAIEAWINSANVKKKFEEVLDKGASAFTTSLLSLVKNNSNIAACDPKTTMAAAMTAATMKLPINPNLGFAYLVPYKNKGHMECTFQMGYKGFIQLAMRSGQYKTINAAKVYEGQIEDVDFVTGDIIRGKKKSNTVVGYVAYFELLNGFSKTLYMSKDEMEAHAAEYSQSYLYDRNKGYSSSVWSKNFDAMALKTAIKQLISKYGIMSVDMQSEAMAMAIERDQAVIGKNGTATYVDNDRHGAEPKDITPQVKPQAFEEAVTQKANEPEFVQAEPSDVPADDDEPNF